MPEQSIPVVTEVGNFYDRAGSFLQTLSGDNTHVGYWEDDTDNSSFSAAQDRLTDLLGSKLDIRPGQRLLDVGCGIGRPALRLARLLEVDVTGIAVSEWQIEQAEQSARQQDLAERVNFRYADAMALPFEDDSFDAALALEVLIHISDVGQALSEISRVVRPGGRLVVSDIVIAKEMTAQQRETFTSIMPFNWPVPSVRDYHGLLQDTGFQIVESVNCTRHIKRSYQEIRDGITRRRENLVAACGQEVFDELSLGIRSLTDTIEDCTEYISLTVTNGRP